MAVRLKRGEKVSLYWEWS